MKKQLVALFTRLFLTIILLGGCGAAYKYDEGYLNLSASLPKKWKVSALPVRLKVSDSFDASSFTSINNMAAKWNDAYTGGEFFQLTHNTSEKNYAHADNYLDNEMGIYNLTNWPAPLPGEALAVTQTFSNINQENGQQYIEIFHVDVLINNEDHNVSNVKSAGSYYLQTIMIHELGHALGLRHYEGYWEPSVMIPAISEYHTFNSLYDYDVQNINQHYFGTTTATARTFARASLATEPADEDIHVEHSILPGTNIIKSVYEIRKKHFPPFLYKYR